MTIKNKLIRSFLSIWKKLFSHYPVDSQYPRYLIVSTTGLGDTLWATPAIKTLRATEPNAYIALLTTSLGSTLLETNPYLDHIFILRRSFFSKIKLIFSLRNAHLPTCIIFHSSQRCVLPLCIMAGSSKIVGTQGQFKGLDHLLTERLPPTFQHEIERRIELVSKAHNSAVKRHSLLEFFITPEDAHAYQQFLEPFQIPPYLPLIALHPGAKDPFKCWPPHLFVKLGKRLKEEWGCQILITGNPSEKNLVTQIAHEIPGAIPCFNLPIRTLGALYQSLKLLITNDTGPMHIGFALNTPTVALFTATDPRLCGPYLASNVAIIKKAPTCQPCLRKRCQTPFCLLQISPEEVFETASKFFHNQGGHY